MVFFIQNVLIGYFGNHESSRLTFQILIATKSVLISIMVCISFALKQNWNIKKIFSQKIIYFTVAVLMVFSLFFILSPHPTMARAASLRNIAMPLLAFIFGYLIYSGSNFFRIIYMFLYFSVFLAIFGLFEFFFIDDKTLYDTFNIQTVYYAKVNRFVIPGTLFSDIGGYFSRRLVSFTSDPLAVGYWLCFVSLMAFALKRFTIFFILLIPLFLTFNKTAIAIVFISIFLFWVEMRLKNVFIKTFMYSISIGIYVVGILTLYLFVKSSANSHILGLVGGLTQGILNPFGLGLGSGGYFSWIYNITEQGANAYSMGSDSAVGSVAAQIGIVGLVIYLGWFYYIFRAFTKFHLESKTDLRVLTILKTLIFSFIIALPMTENIMSINVNFILFILVGMYFRKMNPLPQKNVENLRLAIA